MAKPAFAPDSELAARLRAAVAKLHRRLRQEAAAGLTPSQSSVLATVARLQSPTLKAIAEAEQVQPPTISKVIEFLLARGLLLRSTDEIDRRVSRVALTPLGRSTLKQVRAARSAFLAERLADMEGMDHQRLEELVAVLEAMSS
ncbi:MAG: MarR family transcriptional regulator [Actinomycetota bacterium]